MIGLGWFENDARNDRMRRMLDMAHLQSTPDDDGTLLSTHMDADMVWILLRD